MHAKPLPDLAYAKAAMLLTDPGHTAWLGQTTHLASPTLVAQNLPVQDDDGVVILWGRRQGHRLLTIATDPDYMGGSLGEVGGAKIATALIQADTLARQGPPQDAPRIVLWLDGGGVRLQEGTAALLAAQSVLAAVAQAGERCHVVSIVTPKRGCYGAMALVAGLSHHRFMVSGSRLGLNGPRVIAQRHKHLGNPAMDAATIDAMQGSQQRDATGLITKQIENNRNALDEALAQVFKPGPNISSFGQPQMPQPDAPAVKLADSTHQGLLWFLRLTEPHSRTSYAQGTVWTGIAYLQGQRVLCVTLAPGEQNPQGELGCAQADALANLWASLHMQKSDSSLSPIQGVVVLVDTPGQAMAHAQEAMGLHQKMAHAFYQGRELSRRGYPTAALLVGQAVSGAFLCLGLVCQQILTLNAPNICIRAMAGQSVAQVTGRSEAQQNTLAQTIDALRTDAEAFVRMGGAAPLLHWPLRDVEQQGVALVEIKAALAKALRPEAQRPTRNVPIWASGWGSRTAAAEVWAAACCSTPPGSSAEK